MNDLESIGKFYKYLNAHFFCNNCDSDSTFLFFHIFVFDIKGGELSQQEMSELKTYVEKLKPKQAKVTKKEKSLGMSYCTLGSVIEQLYE